ncbi:peptidoglycan glycosyltransferase [Acidocella aquatica]|uniref:Peptidoglycan glycosyltransferase n=1 Tax=Acidocella aquatica TaxID=1922313 RepID=A0ABQ6A7L7_9PROT|nr:penicillin-binding protein 2 [Acidocella aquatica]GLR67697.1 peptidoglycan glycosyltransferase [Acidocella aquatica]
MKRETKDRAAFNRRALLIGTAQLGIFGAIAGRLYNLQVAKHGKYALLAEQNSISERLEAPIRGLITDRFGTILAGNEQHWRALFMQALAPDPQAVLDNFYRLVPLPDDEKARIAAELAHRPGYIPVLLKDYLDWPDMAALEVNTPDLPGVVVEVGASRSYPFGPGLAHAVGYVARPNAREAAADPVLSLPGIRIGRTGAEAGQDGVLRGVPGFVQTETNVHGQVVRQVAHDPGTPGQTVALALDAGLQALAVQRLANQTGAVVMLDANTGEILAMASSPSFDPSLFDKGVPSATWNAWMADAGDPLQNKVISGLFAPGSTFKPTVALAAMKAGTLSADTILTCPGFFKLGDHVFWCDNHVAHGSITVTTALQVSCDVFFYQVALKVGIDRIADMATTMGLGTDLGVDLPNASPGLVPTLDWARRRGIHWVEGSTVVQGIGQGYTQLTPLALATMIARVATGSAVGPHITRRIGGQLQDGSDPGDWPVLEVDAGHLATIRQGLFEVVNTPAGTAYGARLTLPNVQMAGKTGTAQVHTNTAAEKQKGFNDLTMAWEQRPNALFVGFAPYDNPRYAVAVVIEHGNFGAQTAAPIAQDMMTYALTHDPAGRDVPLGGAAGVAPS